MQLALRGLLANLWPPLASTEVGVSSVSKLVPSSCFSYLGSFPGLISCLLCFDLVWLILGYTLYRLTLDPVHNLGVYWWLYWGCNELKVSAWVIICHYSKWQVLSIPHPLLDTSSAHLCRKYSTMRAQLSSSVLYKLCWPQYLCTLDGKLSLPIIPHKWPLLKEGLKELNILGSVQKSRWSKKIKEFEIMLLKKEKQNNQEPDNTTHSQLAILTGVREKN